MATKPFTRPVENSVAKVNDEVAVGEDLEFQRKWWRFENAAWIAFTLIIVLDLSGLFGRGPLAKAQRHAADGTMDVKYERIERTASPSIMTIQFGPSAIKDGKVQLYIGNSLIKLLGTQRVIPAPQETVVGEGGLTYSFPASKPPASVDLALQPLGPGIFDFTIGVVGAQRVHAKVVVVP
ncbi:MAG TPA: hypothetical protein VFE27_07020 [Acidobacteriaceae bacterium]|jgi:hypothetical protein|nr:hypothetical protein [Acidobacteriaceae bacterium]